MNHFWAEESYDIVDELVRQYGLKNSVDAFFNNDATRGIIQAYHRKLKEECKEILDDPVSQWMNTDMAQLTNYVESFELDEFAFSIKLRCERYIVGSIRRQIIEKVSNEKIQNGIDELKRALYSGTFMLIFYSLVGYVEEEYESRLISEIRNLNAKSQYDQYFKLLSESLNS